MKKATISKIINTVTQFYNISPTKLRRKSRKAKYIKPRHVAMYLLREELNKSYPYIGRLFGSRDHATAIHAYDKITEQIKNSPELKLEIEKIRNTLHNGLINKNLDDKNVNLEENKREQKNMSEKKQDKKRERFKRLAVYRTNEALKRLKILGNCANRSAYDYTEGEVNKIFSEIERKVREIKAKFHFPKKEEFKL